MADYNIKAEITADASGFEAGIKKAQKASKNLSTSLSKVIQGLGKSGLVGALGAVGLATGGVVTVLNTVSKVAKKVAQTVDECSQAYRKQYQAEIALSTAVNNNPYVDGTATKRLKEFASEMQRVSDIGDEELLPMMADLIAKGRTEDETMQIMSVALDMSAGGAMSLETAITQLNATLNGNVGRLGQQNAELKDLTEEELKQGKAVEILGAKYKGLAQATADSQKQLRNAIGDLKENIGQIFEQALSPMRKFFTEVITNLNNSITKSRELKTAMKEAFGDNGEVNLGASTDALNTAFTEVLHKQQEVTKNYQQYIQLYGKYIDVATDETALSYKAQISDLNAQLKAISEELNKRRRESEEEKKRLAKEKADAEAKAELEKQKEIREKELAVENEWADKLFNIRIENLERTREKELENEELTEEQKIAIYEFYGDQILSMKIKQIEKERDEALKGENLTEEAKEKIRLYYENKITNARKDEEGKRLKLKNKTSEEEVKDEKKKFAEMVKIAIEYTKKLADTFKKVAKQIVSTVKNVLSGIGNIFTKVIEFNPNDALDNLLKFEDAVLTFFVETLPKLPSFFQSAVQSIIVLIDTIISMLDFDVISNIVENILKAVLNGITSVSTIFNKNADMITKGLTQLVSTIISNLSEWVESGGWRELLDAIINIQQMLEQVVIDNIDELANTIIEMLPDLIEALKKSITSASKTLKKIMPIILPLIADILNAIIEVITSDEVLDSFYEALEGIVEGLIPAIMKLMSKGVLKLVNFGTKLVGSPSSITKIVSAIITGFIKGFQRTDWVQVIKDIFQGFVDAFKNFFGIHSPSTLFEGFGKNIMQGLLNGLKSLASNVQNFFTNLWSKITNVFNGAGDWFKSTFSKCADGIKSAFDGMKDWFSKLWDNITSTASSAVEKIKEAGNKAGEAIKKGATGKNDDPASTATRVGIGILTGGISEIGHGLGLWANGTNNVPSGLSIVGEAGPELVRFRGGEQILNNRNTNKALAEMGKSTNNFNVTFNNLQDTTAFAMMNQLKAYNRQMAINGII